MVLPVEEFRAVDANAVFRGASLEDLMERAGKAVATEAGRRWTRGSFTVLCGTGNNGGDGFVAARLLDLAGRRVQVLVVGDRDRIAGPAANALGQMQRAGLDAKPWKPGRPLEGDVIIDAILGSGILGRLRDPVRSAVDAVNRSGKPVLSVDIPTGFGAEESPAIHPTATVTVLDEKEGMRAYGSGEIVVADIGFPEKAHTHVGPGQLQLYYPRGAAAGHKGDNGRLVIVGGGPYTGAPVLSADAALHTGIDLVVPVLPERAALRAMTARSEFVVEALPGNALSPEHLDRVLPQLERASCLLAGPGAGQEPQTGTFFEELLAEAGKRKVPCVVDADALTHLPPRHARPPMVVTPHHGEFRRMSDLDVPADPTPMAGTLRQWAAREGVVLLLKGPLDLITDGERVLYNDVHHESMTMGGTGDVLAGSVAALVARGLAPFRAAQVGAYLVGAAGRKAFDDRSWGVTTQDLIERIPRVLKEHL